MKKSIFLLALFSSFYSFKCFSLSDSLYPLTDQELLKLSNLIYELEKKDSMASANEPNGFDLKSKESISDISLLVDLTNDSVHYYTGVELIKLSNYIFELERRDSIRQVKELEKESMLAEQEKLAKDTEAFTYCVQIGAYKLNPTIKGVIEFHRVEKEDGVVKYLSGEFKTVEEAEERMKELLEKGIVKEAYIVKFKDGKPIN
jgi:hypothetical protein